MPCTPGQVKQGHWLSDRTAGQKKDTSPVCDGPGTYDSTLQTAVTDNNSADWTHRSAVDLPVSCSYLYVQ